MPEPNPPLEAYRLRLSSAQAALARLDAVSAPIANGRAAAFFLAVALGARGEVQHRQGAVGELTAKLDFRQRLVVEAQARGRDKVDPEPFVRWAESDPALGAIRWARPLPFVLPPLTLALYALSVAGTI